MSDERRAWALRLGSFLKAVADDLDSDDERAFVLESVDHLRALSSEPGEGELEEEAVRLTKEAAIAAVKAANAVRRLLRPSELDRLTERLRRTPTTEGEEEPMDDVAAGALYRIAQGVTVSDERWDETMRAAAEATELWVEESSVHHPYSIEEMQADPAKERVGLEALERTLLANAASHGFNVPTGSRWLLSRAQNRLVAAPEPERGGEDFTEWRADSIAERLVAAHQVLEAQGEFPLYGRPFLLEAARRLRLSEQEGERACGICGGRTVFIRGRHPGEDRREVCPTCLQERAERAVGILKPNPPMAAAHIHGEESEDDG